jgi:hypothetical protein
VQDQAFLVIGSAVLSRERVRSESALLLVDVSSETCAALGATCVDDFAAALGGHASAEAMLALANDFTGLECTLHKKPPLKHLCMGLRTLCGDESLTQLFTACNNLLPPVAETASFAALSGGQGSSQDSKGTQ